MAKIKYNVKGVDRSGGNYEQPQPGLYEMEIKEVNARLDGGKNDIELILEITPNNANFVGARVWSYVNLGDASAWKLAELTDALGLPEQGEIDTVKLLGKKLKVKVNADSWNNEYRARAGRFAPLEATAEEVEAADDPDAGGGGGDDDPDAPVAAAADEPEFVTVERNNVEISNDPEYYAEWSEDDAIEEVENQGLELGRKKKTKANIVAALIELVNAEVGGDAAEPAAEPDPEVEGDNYDDAEAWSDADLAAEYKKRELSTIDGKKNRAKVIAALREDDANDDPFAD